MRLKEYFKEGYMTPKELAEKAGLDVSWIYRHCSRNAPRASTRRAVQIEQATEGKVTRLEVLYTDEELEELEFRIKKNVLFELCREGLIDKTVLARGIDYEERKRRVG